MFVVLLALLVAFTLATGIVLADSGLRLWSAFGGLRAQQAMLRTQPARFPTLREPRKARVTTRVSFERPVPLRAAA